MTQASERMIEGGRAWFGVDGGCQKLKFWGSGEGKFLSGPMMRVAEDGQVQFG